MIQHLSTKIRSPIQEIELRQHIKLNGCQQYPKTGRIAASLKSKEKNGREKERKKIQIENGGELLSPPTEVT